MRTLIKALIAAGFLAGLSISFAQPLSFLKEEIQITVNEGFCDVTGTYYFVSPTNKKIEKTIYYPFPVNKLAFPDSIFLNIPKTGKVLNYKKGKKGIYFRLEVKDTAVVQVFYRQPVSKNEMTYILTSTQEWNKPLQEASFEITVPGNIDITGISYPWHYVESKDGYKTYHIIKNKFMPKKDLHIEWAGRQ